MSSEMRALLINELCDVGELIRKGGDYFEDMGGHLLHESNLDSYIENYLSHLSEGDVKDLVKLIRGHQ